MQRQSAQPADGGTNQQTTMGPTATTSFDLLALPQELRDDIYESAIFDLSPPEMVRGVRGRMTTFTYRHMNTNILLTSRKVYWEARNMIMCRGRLVMVSATRLHNGLFEGRPVPVDMLTGWPGIGVIHPKYRNLCTMNHYINAARSALMPESNEGGDKWEFILHQRDIKIFCHTLMGKFNPHAESMLGPRSTHTLVLHCPSSYAQHECMGVNEMQTRVLQQYRSILRGFEDLSIRGTCTGWESGLYSASLRDMRSADTRRELAGFIDRYMDELHALEKEGIDTLAQTRDLEAADASWTKAIGICQNAQTSFVHSFRPPSTYYKRTRHASDTQNWAQLRRVHGNECALPIIKFWYRLLSIRVSEVLRLIQRGGHLATRHGRGRTDPWQLGDFVVEAWCESQVVGSYFRMRGWLPQPSEETQMCCTVAAALRLLDDPLKRHSVSIAVGRARYLSPDDDAVKQEAIRGRDWIRRWIRDRPVADSLQVSTGS